jgi:uncharacterized membrane protein (DUF2068 family)
MMKEIAEAAEASFFVLLAVAGVLAALGGAMLMLSIGLDAMGLKEWQEWFGECAKDYYGNCE